MAHLAAILKWLAYGAIFFACFAFAVNNLHDVTVKLFFGSQLRVPMVLIVLCAFAAGLLAGVVAMLPRWWLLRRRRHGA